jgi:hypothetical protein
MKVVMYPTRTGQEKTISLGKIDQVTTLDWFPDGSKMLICGNVKGGPPTCGAVPAGGGEFQPLTPDGTTAGTVSPDGREILARSDNFSYNIYKIGSNDPPIPLVKDSAERVVGWSPTGRGVIVRKSLSLKLERLDLATGARQVIVDEPIDLTGVLAIRNLVVASDPHVFAYVMRSVQSRIYLVQGVK